MRKILDYIDELRQRPEAARRRVLVLASSGITLVIFFVWLWNFNFIRPDFGQMAKQVESVKAQTAAVGLSEAFGRLKNGWQVLMERLKN